MITIKPVNLLIQFSRLYTRRLYSVYLPEFDIEYYCNADNISEIRKNISKRKGVGDINKVIEAYNSLTAATKCNEPFVEQSELLHKELLKLPNKTHPTVLKYDDEPQVLKMINKKRDFGNYKAFEFSEITRLLNIMRTDRLGYTCGHKSYYFMSELAELEEALIKYAVTNLLKKNFTLVSVPDILPSTVLESCGMMINSDRTQIYSLDPVHHGADLCLSGTAEMSLAGLLMNSVHDASSLPIKMAAVSRCYRAETSNLIEEKGIYRVHQFTKVEMFAVTTPEQSEEMLEHIRHIQEELFTPLGLHMRVLDMPPHELGAPAYRKYDIEAWLPGRQTFGEISSCSNCTDYQSRRLLIKYDKGGNKDFTHTLNGTACAVPRTLIALLETHQNPKGKIAIPEILQPFMSNKEFITKNINVPDLKLAKTKK